MSPFVSIITITFNRAKYVGEAVESVISQTFRDFEMIVVDDASTDDTPTIVAEYQKKDARIRYLKNETNLNIPRSRNRGLKEAKGKYIAVLDSDDVWADPEKLKKQVDFLENNPGYALIGGGAIVIDESGREIRRWLNPSGDAEIRRKMLFMNPFVHSGALYLKKAAIEAGGYDESLAVSEDYDLWLKMGKFWKFANLEDYLVKYRVYSQGGAGSPRLQAAINSKALVRKYKNFYPGYFRALASADSRIIFRKLKNLFVRKSAPQRGGES